MFDYMLCLSQAATWVHLSPPSRAVNIMFHSNLFLLQGSKIIGLNLWFLEILFSQWGGDTVSQFGLLVVGINVGSDWNCSPYYEYYIFPDEIDYDGCNKER
jgi:hypothetical protein